MTKKERLEKVREGVKRVFGKLTFADEEIKKFRKSYKKSDRISKFVQNRPESLILRPKYKRKEDDE